MRSRQFVRALPATRRHTPRCAHHRPDVLTIHDGQTLAGSMLNWIRWVAGLTPVMWVWKSMTGKRNAAHASREGCSCSLGSYRFSGRSVPASSGGRRRVRLLAENPARGERGRASVIHLTIHRRVSVYIQHRVQTGTGDVQPKWETGVRKRGQTCCQPDCSFSCCRKAQSAPSPFRFAHLPLGPPPPPPLPANRCSISFTIHP